jgi:hypothetical protein
MQKLTQPILPYHTLLLLLALSMLLLGACATPAAQPLPAATAAPTEEVAATATAEVEIEATQTPAAAEESVMTATPQPEAEADQLLQINLVVQPDDHQSFVRQITTTGPITGLAALEASGLEVVTTSFDWGTAVCSIAGTGCPAEDCFCGGNTFWNYQYWDGEGWQGYPAGAASVVLTQTGAIEGWQWAEFGDPAVPAPQALAAHAALRWLEENQLATPAELNAGSAIEILFAQSANLDPSPTLVDSLQQQAAAHTQQGVAEAGKIAVALAAAGGCWPADALSPSSYYSPTIQSFSDQTGFLAWSILGALALEEETSATALEESIAYLVELAQPEGGWEWSSGWGRDTNSTALALQALSAAGLPVTHTAITSGLEFLRSGQNEDGGFPYEPGGAWGSDSDANSTAYVIQGLLAAGEDPAGPAWRPAGNSPYDFLLSVQLPDGALPWQAGQEANASATQQAIPALLGRSFPLARGLAACNAGAAQ